MTENAARVDPDQIQRSGGPLWLAWGATLALEFLLYWLSRQSPALNPLVGPLYAVALIPAAIATWRWRRPRESANRRDGDRRRLFRRARRVARS